MPASADFIFGEAEDMWKRAAQAIGEDVTRSLVAKPGVPGDPAFN
jgi:hypothetical protein